MMGTSLRIALASHTIHNLLLIIQSNKNYLTLEILPFQIKLVSLMVKIFLHCGSYINLLSRRQGVSNEYSQLNSYGDISKII